MGVSLACADVVLLCPRESLLGWRPNDCERAVRAVGLAHTLACWSSLPNGASRWPPGTRTWLYTAYSINPHTPC